MLGRGAGSPKKITWEALICSGWKNRKKRDADDDKRSTPYNILVERASAKFACASLRYLSGISRKNLLTARVKKCKVF